MTNPLVHPETPEVAVPCGCILGEGALWDHRTGTLLWVDIERHAVWRWRPSGGDPRETRVGEPVGFVALTEDHDIVIAGLKSGLARLHLFGGEVQPLLDPEPDLPGNRINDGTAGPHGELYFGTMDMGEAQDTGTFWRWNGREATAFGERCPITNGPAVSPDGQVLYTVDTKARLIYAHPLDGSGPGEGQRFARFEEEWGNPDGLCVDQQGHVWACGWGGSRVMRFAPDGSVERIVPLPTSQPTKCAFGGEDLMTLFVTTASTGLDRGKDGLAGHVFRVRTDIRGVPAHIVGGA